jgi:cobalt-zinc-cadmium efflux system protein
VTVGAAPSVSTPRRPLRTATLLTLVVLAVELAAGVVSHSVALLADAGHVLTDLIALSLAWFATVQQERPADGRRTYGYHRTGIVTALLNAVLLIVVILWIAYEAAQRLRHPAQVTPWIMVAGAAIGIVVNVYIGLGLRGHGKANLNIRAAALHVFGDVAASAAVIVTAGVIAVTRWTPADPLLSLAIAALIGWGAWDVVRQALDVLMEAAPRDVDAAELVRDLMRDAHVQDVHDLHIWSIADGMRLLSAHIQVDADYPLSACDGLRRSLGALLRERYGIAHATLQMECAPCAESPLYCAIGPQPGAAASASRRDGRAETHVH